MSWLFSRSSFPAPVNTISVDFDDVDEEVPNTDPVDLAAQEAAQQALSSRKETAPSTFSYVKPWSWFQKKPKQEDAETTSQSQTSEEQEAAPEPSEFVIVDAVDTEEQSGSPEQQGTAELIKTDTVAPGFLQKLGALNKIGDAVVTGVAYAAGGIAYVGATAAQSSAARWTGRKLLAAGEAALKTNLGQKAVKAIANWYINDAASIEKAKKRMAAALNDPQFIEFYEVSSNLIADKVLTKLFATPKPELDAIIEPRLQKGVIHNVLRINLALAFANIAENMKQNAATIPNYDNQPAFANFVALLCQKVNVTLDDPKLTAIHNTQNSEEKNGALFAFFQEKASDIFSFIFPNPTSLVLGPLSMIDPTYFFDVYIRDILATFLKDTYQSVFIDKSKELQWKAEITKRVGEGDVEPILEAPAKFLIETAKKYIQTDPNAIGKVADLLGSLKTSHIQVENGTQLAQLAHEPLARSIVGSLQCLLNTQDPHVKKSGTIVNNLVKDIILALLSKGSQLAFPDGQRIEQDQLMKKLVDRAIEKFNALSKGEKIDEKTVDDILNELPIPALMRKSVHEEVQKKVAELYTHLDKAKAFLRQVDDLHQTSLKALQQYNGKGGEDLIVFSEEMANTIFKLAFSQLKSGQLEALLEQYLPGVQLDASYLSWLQNNVTSFGGGSIEGDHSTALIKKALHAILLKALVTTIEVNFKEAATKNYASALVGNICTAFENNLSLDETNLKLMREANEIQGKIREIKDTITAMRASLKDLMNEGLTTEAKDLIKKERQLQRKENEADMSVKKLQDQYDGLLAQAKKNDLLTKSGMIPEGGNDRLEKVLALHKHVLFESSKWVNKEDRSNEIVFLQKMVTAWREILEKAQQDREFASSADGIAKIAEAQRFLPLVDDLKLLLTEFEGENLEIFNNLLKLKTTLDYAKAAALKANQDLKAIQLSNQTLPQDVLQQREHIIAAHLRIEALSYEERKLTEQLESKLGGFPELSKELAKIIGLDRPETFLLPDQIKKHVWPMIAKLKDCFLPSMLQDQLSVPILVIADMDKDRAYLKEKTGNDVLSKVCAETAKVLLNDLPQSLNSEEVAVWISQAIPGAANSPGFIKLQVEAIINGKDPALVKLRSSLQNYLEGLLLKECIASVDRFPQRDLLVTITGKLRSIATSPEWSNPNLDTVKASEKVVQQLVEEIMGIKSASDIKGFPPALQPLVYSKIKTAVQEQVQPFVLPFIESEKNKRELIKISGSNALVQLSDALSKDLLTFVEGLIPDQILSGELFTKIDPALRKDLAARFKEAMNSKGPAFENIHVFAEQYAQGILLRIFLQIARKNPAAQDQNGKPIDTILVFTQNFLKTVEKMYPRFKSEPFEKVADEFNKEILEGILGITQTEFAGLPPSIAAAVYKLAKGKLNEFIVKFQNKLGALETGAKKLGMAEVALGEHFGVEKESRVALAKIVSDDIGAYLVDALPFLFGQPESTNGQMAGEFLISTSIRSYLEGLAGSNIAVAKVLLKYPDSAAFGDMLRSGIEKAGNRNILPEERKKIAELASNFVLGSLNKGLSKLIEKEEVEKEKLNQRLAKDLLTVGLEYLQTINKAKKLAAADKRSNMSYRDFIQAAGPNLHKAIPKDKVDEAHFNEQLEREFAEPLTVKLLTSLFPNGPADLTFLPEEVRESVWGLVLKKANLSKLIELLLDPDVLMKSFVSGLEATVDKLRSQKIVLHEIKPPADQTDGEINKLCGKLLLESMERAKLPVWVKNYIVNNPDTVDQLAESMSSSIFAEFDEKFLRTRLKEAFQRLAVRNEAGEADVIRFDFRDEGLKRVEREVKYKENAQKLESLTKQAIDASIGYFGRKRWAQFQESFDDGVEHVFGSIGYKVKQGLDVFFSILVFKIIGVVLEYLARPVTAVVKKGIYHFAHLDENRQELFDLFLKKPEDQPDVPYVAYNADLVVKLTEAFVKTLENPELPETPAA